MITAATEVGRRKSVTAKKTGSIDSQRASERGWRRSAAAQRPRARARVCVHRVD